MYPVCIRMLILLIFRYIASGDNLKVMMNLLCNPSRNIQFEAFHVFKVFVANPNKSQPVGEILLKNRDKLVEFLSRYIPIQHSCI